MFKLVEIERLTAKVKGLIASGRLDEAADYLLLRHQAVIREFSFGLTSQEDKKTCCVLLEALQVENQELMLQIVSEKNQLPSLITNCQKMRAYTTK